MTKYLLVFIFLTTCSKGFCQNNYDSSECDSNLFVPKSLCPNGDGINDVFTVKFTNGKTPVVFTMWIYNRWGEIVYETRDLLYGGWDGRTKNKGSQAQDGVYVWKVEYYYKIGGEKMSCIGYMSLIR